ncbi:MAG: GNAT family N-acetyltransferase [Pirellulales bacterium]
MRRAPPAAHAKRGHRQSAPSQAAGQPVEQGPGVRLVAARAGDHTAIHQFLTAVFQGPTRDGFHSSLDDPFYEPHDRLVVKRGGRIISHLQLTQRVMCLGSARLPVAGLHWLGTLPEFRRQGHARQLLEAAESVMADNRTLLGVLTTREPRFFSSVGWAVCGRQSQARAGSRDLLAQLSVRGLPPAEQPLTIRPWRQVELPALMRLYQENTATAAGPYQRSEAYWRWLISRKEFDQVWVAVEGPDRLELDFAGSQVVGYAVTRDDRVIELLTAADHPTAAEQLLARACSEAIERDQHSISLSVPPGDRLFDLFQTAGGTLHQTEAFQGEVQMMKLIDPGRLLRAMAAELHRRAVCAGLARPCELGLQVDGQKYHLVLSRRSVQVRPHRLGRSYLTLSMPELTRLVAGHLDVGESIEAGRVAASTRLAGEIAQVLFPRLPLWRPSLDDLVS